VLFDALPDHVQRQARQAYRLFTRNPWHPSLQFKQIGKRDSSIYAARVGIHYRAICFLESEK
jgi:hypothetical protein